MKKEKKANGEGMREFNHRMTRPHLCEGCKVVELPPSSLRFCPACRDLLAKSL